MTDFMHTISSKFRGLFIGKIVFLAFVASVIIIFFLRFLLIMNGVESQIFLVLVLGIVIVLSVLIIYRIITVMKVNVLENKLEIYSFFGKKTEIFFSDITKIETQKFVQSSKAGNITDGYHYSILILKNGKWIAISPDEFENYNEIMAAIRNRRNS